MDKLFDFKRRYIASDGEEYIDMCIPSYDIEKINAYSLTRLNQDHSGRIDTFTFGNVNKSLDDIDVVMYTNKIYNPFAINEGEIFYIPKSDDSYFTQEEPILIDGTLLSQKQSGEKAKTYAETVEYLAKMGLGII